MKLKNLFLAIFMLTAFGSAEFYSQTATPAPTTAPSHPKRTYTKKTTATTTTIQNGKPVTTSVATTKPKRTYVKKTTVVAPVPTKIPTNVPTAVAPKRTYVRKTTTTVAPAAHPAPAVRKSAGYQQTASGEVYNGHPVMVGPKGGKYYINSNGNKTYIK